MTHRFRIDAVAVDAAHVRLHVVKVSLDRRGIAGACGKHAGSRKEQSLHGLTHALAEDVTRIALDKGITYHRRISTYTFKKRNVVDMFLDIHIKTPARNSFYRSL